MSFELWLFAIKHFGQTMEVAKTIFDSMSDDRQQSLRDEYERYISGGSAADKTKGNGDAGNHQSKSASGMVSLNKIRLTVLKKECYADLQYKYLHNQSTGECRRFNVGDEFIIDKDSYNSMPGAMFCTQAWEAISKYIYTGIQGGSFINDMNKDNNTMIVSCTEGTRPVIFKLEKI